MLIKVKNDDRTHMHDPAAIAMGMKEKAHIEANWYEYLTGASGFEMGDDTPAEMRPHLPDGAKGLLLAGMKSRHRASKTLDEAKSDHARLVSMGYLAKDAPLRWFNPSTREYEVHEWQN